MAERVAVARPSGAIRMGDVIEQIISRDNLQRLVSSPARMPGPPTPQRDGPIELNAHLLPFRCRVDSSDKDKPERPELPPRRPHLKFDDDAYEQNEDAESALLRYNKKARRRVNPFIDA